MHMRPIKFRGKRIDNGEWVYGPLCMSAKYAPYILWSGNDSVVIETPIIDKDSIGEYTGLLDKNGKVIYDGDIILYGGTIHHEVVFRHGSFCYLLYGGEFVSYAGNTNFTFKPLNRSKDHEVVGNIHDNPELRQPQYDDTTSIH